MFDSQSSKPNAAGPLAWLSDIFSRSAMDARLKLAERTRKLPPISKVLDGAGREPLPRE
jgi:hypothetical protein